MERSRDVVVCSSVSASPSEIISRNNASSFAPFLAKTFQSMRAMSASGRDARTSARRHAAPTSGGMAPAPVASAAIAMAPAAMPISAHAPHRIATEGTPARCVRATRASMSAFAAA